MYSSGYGAGGTTYGGGSTFADYVPKGGPSRVWFHVLVDPSLLEDEEVVTLRGNLEALGSWGPGVRLARAADDPFVWEAEVELPIGMAETHFRGLFDYRFALEPADLDGPGEVLEEGSSSLDTNDMQMHFYHSFRANYVSSQPLALSSGFLLCLPRLRCESWPSSPQTARCDRAEGAAAEQREQDGGG